MINTLKFAGRNVFFILVALGSCSQSASFIESSFFSSNAETNDRSILLSADERSLRAKFILNTGSSTSQFIEQLRELLAVTAQKHSKVAIVTGPYSDSSGKVVGVSFKDGIPVNLKAENWDGFVSIDKNGILAIRDISEVGIPKGVLLKQTPELFNYFSGFQTHLIVLDGISQVSDRAPKVKARRRALTVNFEGRAMLIDTLDKKISLHEFSDLLVREYRTIRGVNLDMGTYNLCLLQMKGVRIDCSEIGESVQLDRKSVV